jgi:hypothetical protein
MALLNYTTNVNAARTVGEIQEKLAKAGAHQILHEYSDGGVVTALSFRIKTKFGDMAFRLPANIHKVREVLRKQFPRSKAAWDRAPNVGWRILKDWIEAQLALIQTEMVTIEEVFLPYLQDDKGTTLYEALERKRFSGFAQLEDKKQ